MNGQFPFMFGFEGPLGYVPFKICYQTSLNGVLVEWGCNDLTHSHEMRSR